MRGKGGPVPSYNAGRRITPAYAGKSRTVWFGITGKRDHPRACGEKIPSIATAKPLIGSPPRMRGKDKKDPVTPCLLRLLYCVFLQFAIDLLDHARHLVHLSFLRAQWSSAQAHRPCRAPCPDTAPFGTVLHRSPAKHPRRSLPTGSPAECRAWQSAATAPGSR